MTHNSFLTRLCRTACDKVNLTLTALAALSLIALAAPRAQAQYLLVSSYNTDSILRYDATTGDFVDVFVPPASGGLSRPTGLTFGPDGNLYVGSSGTNRILRYSGTTGAFLGAFAADVNAVYDLVFGPDGNLYVNGSSRILRYHGTTGAFLDTFVPLGSGGLNAARGLAFGPDGHLYVNNTTSSSILRYHGTTGAFLDAFVRFSGLNRPVGLAFGPDNSLYVSNSAAPEYNFVVRYHGPLSATPGAPFPSPSGIVANFVADTRPPGGLREPVGLAFGPDGNLCVCDARSHGLSNSVKRYDSATGYALPAPGNAAGIFAAGGGLSRPMYLTFSPAARSEPVVTIDAPESTTVAAASPVSFTVNRPERVSR